LQAKNTLRLNSSSSVLAQAFVLRNSSCFEDPNDSLFAANPRVEYGGSFMLAE
jgi:hypothetical protein